MKINNVDVSKTYDKSTDSSGESVFHVAHSSKIPAVNATLLGKKNTILS